MEKIQENRMGYEPIGKLLSSMSLPAIISMLVNALYNIIDSIFVSAISEDALSAITYAFPIQMLNIAFAVGTSIGINSLMARRLGAKRIEEAQKVANHGMRLAVMNWLIFAFFGIFIAGSYMHLFTKTEYILNHGIGYLKIVTIGSIFIMISVMIERLFQATGQMKIPMLTSIAGAFTNIILDPLFIFGYGPFPKWEMEGAAVATVLGQVLCCALNIYFLKKHNKVFNIRLKGFKFEKQMLKDIYTVAFSAIVMQSITSFMVLALNGMLSQFSETAVAVLGAYFRLQSFVFMPVFGLNQGAMPVMGYNFGARNRKRLMKTYKTSFLWALIYMSIGMIIFEIFPKELLLMFHAKQDMLEIGIPALRAIAICFVPASYGIMCNTLFQSTGHGFLSLMSPIIRQLIGILPIAYLLINNFGLMSVWYAFPIAEILGTIWAITGFIIVMKKEISGMPMEAKNP